MYGPLLDALREAGGEAQGRVIARLVADRVLGGTPERDEELKSGGNMAENEVAWARSDLREIGLFDGSIRGVWKLTDEGWKTHVANLEEARKLRDKAREIRKERFKLAKLEAAEVDLE